MPKLLKEIRSEMRKLPRDPSKYPKLRVSKLESTPAPGIKSITYKAVVSSEFPKKRKEEKVDIPYITFVRFFDVLFEETKSSKFSVPVKVGSKLLYHPIPTIAENRVQLKCSCADFRFVWEYPLFEQKALIGRFRKYIRVPGSDRPPRNPSDLMGFCKHTWSLLNALNTGKLISGVPKIK